METDDLALESEPVKVLATLFKNEKECSRKMYTVNSAEHIQPALDTGARSEQDQGESSGTGEWITLMKRLRPSAENIPSIKSAMENTYTRRRSWISKATPTLTEIFNEYPRFLDMPSLIDIEFGKITDGKTDQFIRKWEATIIPKLRAVAALEKGGVASLTEGMEDQTDG
ncbi:hypothetical protein PO909_034048 [Leuciscus waleckii]